MKALEEGKKHTLPDGAVVHIRAIQPYDTSALQRLHGRLSELSIRLRFHSDMKELGNQEARYFPASMMLTALR